MSTETQTALNIELPPWVRELDLALPIYPQIVLTGNVRDLYLLPADDAGGTIPLELVEVIERVCTRRGYGALAVHDITRDRMHTWQLGDPSVQLPPGLEEMSAADERTLSSSDDPAPPHGRIRRVLTEVVAHRGPAIGLIIPYAARFGSPRDETEEAASVFATVEALADRARPVPGTAPVTPYNTVFWLVERQEQLPIGFPASSRRIRVIAIPLTLPDQRRAAATHVVRTVLSRSGERHPSDTRVDEAAKTLTAATHGMNNSEVLAVGRMAQDRELPVEQLEEAARLYRIGITDNPWASQTLRERIREGEGFLNSRVYGQPDAVRKTVEIFMRSAAGLTGAQSASSPNRPRGVLFLSGPTGVGKTELAKGIAALIFGRDAEPMRFDMSEFGQEHARERLIGAPPGFVGHDAGGELTNAVRTNPISVLLFDEIDKAHPALFDIFLQILEDGRLTDGRGSTVHFTECVLIFTSNLGLVKVDEGMQTPAVTHHDEPAEVRRVLREAFERFFDRKIGRPELRNRFGDAFVAMDFIRPGIVPEILAKSLASVTKRVEEVSGARLEISAEAHETLLDAAIGSLDHGGRGVTNTVETALVNPLSAELFTAPANRGEVICVERFVPDEGSGWRIEVRRWNKQPT